MLEHEVTLDYETDTNSMVLRAGNPARQRDRVKLVPNLRHRLKENTWACEANWVTAHALRDVFGDNLILSPDITAWAEDELSKWIIPSLALQGLSPKDPNVPGNQQLFPYQRIGTRWLELVRGGVLAWPMGAGKTLAIIAALGEIPDSLPALVVCPKTVKATWLMELKKWAPHLRPLVVGGTATQRTKQFALWAEGNHDVLIINWDNIRNHSRLAPYGSTSLQDCIVCNKLSANPKQSKCERCLGELNKIEFRTVIADEIHRAVDPSTKWTRALWACAQMPSVENRWGLTGTPMRNNVADAWSLLHFAAPNEWRSRSAFIDRFCELGFAVHGPAPVIGFRSSHEAELRRTMDARFLRWPVELMLDALPEKSYEMREVELTAGQRKIYNQLRDDLIASLEDDSVVMGLNPLTQMLRLSQMACASMEQVVVEDGPEVEFGEEVVNDFRLCEPSPKLDALEEILDELDPQEQVVVFSASRQLIELAEKRLTKRGTYWGAIHGGRSDEQRTEALQMFEDKQLRVLLCTVGAASEGLNLQSARVLVVLQRPFSVVQDSQMEGRVWRTGQTRSVLIIDVVAEDTVDDRRAQILEGKRQSFEDLVRDRDKLKQFLTPPMEVKKTKKKATKKVVPPEEDQGSLDV